MLKFFGKGHGLLLEFKIKNKRALVKKKKNSLDPYFAPNKNLTTKAVIT